MHIETLRAIDGIGIFPVISLVLFVVVFAAMLVKTARLDARHLVHQARLPMDDGTLSRSVAHKDGRHSNPQE